MNINPEYPEEDDLEFIEEMKYGVAMRTPGGKGDIQRPQDNKRFTEGYDRIFGKKPKKYMSDILEEQRQRELEEEYNEGPDRD